MYEPDRTLDIGAVTLAVDDRGGGDATPLVLVHGFTGGRIDWADVIDDLAADRRVVRHELDHTRTNGELPHVRTGRKLEVEQQLESEHISVEGQARVDVAHDDAEVDVGFTQREASLAGRGPMNFSIWPVSKYS